ncbi:unnamed protein product (macronuclear) [Paramecium tetraurelia]|uniref:t-SNARE coiled-coil homology domain-containing protein n=1 Tax=Paramecium tetraurelia TaxID=5888 RepID=A0C8S9_PARTE|nr:uncharacterized protein GSPATT00036331001 [Paramecium tetraurelia]CAK67196.1 unnamed protein product [Paramecium tetraurelia]|eukprot:XP_001434593.1 hypothetical protein (macronuclear) [Paramecium tetraurelia strain d4-2]
MASNMFQQNDINFNKKVDEFNNLYKQYSLTQSKQLTLEKMKLIHVQAEQQFKFMEIEYSSFNEQNKQEFAQKFKQDKMLYTECQKKLRDLQLDIDKQPQSHFSKVVTKTQPSQISGLNSDLHTQVKQLNNLDSRLLEAEDTQISILDNLRSQKEKLLRAIEDTKEIQSGVKMTQRHATMIKNREQYNKGILMTLVCILTIGNILIIYYKFVN